MLNWYRIERILGRGGFGVIYLATDTNLEHLVAIKEYRALMPDRESDTDSCSQGAGTPASEGVQSFIREARNLVRFKHPNIVRVMSVFELNDTAYMVMEFEEGSDLREHLQKPENASEEALKELILPISRGLTEIHRHGFVHRDIKPANILVRNDGSPVLLDFGSARSSAQADTENHTALVSAGYSPLEQYSSGGCEQQQGPWTDIYALGAVLYFAITGGEPVDSVKRGSALLNGGKDPLLPARLLGQGRYSEDFLQAIDWALAFRIADRPQMLSDWMSALFRNSISMQATRKITAEEAGIISKVTAIGDTSLDRISMLDESVPPEVRAVRDRRTSAGQPVTKAGDQGNTEELPPTHRHRRRQTSGRSHTSKRLRPLYWLIPLMLASGLAMSWLLLVITSTESDSQKSATDALVTSIPGSAGTKSTTVPPTGESRADDTGTLKSAGEADADASAGAAGKETDKADKRAGQSAERAAEAARQAAEKARLQEEAAEKAAAEKAQAEAAAEKARLAALEIDRRERLRARRLQLAQALSAATRHLDKGMLEEAEASLDEAASLDRNDAELRRLRTRWRSALVDARTPVSDSDFDEVIERFDRLRRAIEDGDVEAMDSLTEPSGQNDLFKQLMSNFSRLDISIDQIRVTNADKSINARLRIVRMIRENGDRATPSPAYRDRTITSRRIEGEWSLIVW